MVNWSSQEEIAKDAHVFEELIHALMGLYVWEIFATSDFEWSLLTRQRKWSWGLDSVLFFLTRYCMLFALIGLLTSLVTTTKINCAALYTFNSWSGNMAILCASTSLMLRTIALWERRLAIVIPLCTLCLAHWALLYRTMFIVKATWSDAVDACIVVATNPSLMRITFFFTMGFDFVILCCTSFALFRLSSRTDLWNLLFRDGLVFFLVSFTGNSVPAILNVLHLNMPMNIIAAIPAACISSIAACRVVMRLQKFVSADVYVHTASNVAPPIVASGPRASRHVFPRSGVHITTEHITMAEFPALPSNSHYGMTRTVSKVTPFRKTVEADEEREKVSSDFSIA